MIAWLSRALEWSARLVLVNWPVYLMSIPELDRATALLISYLVFQVVGLLYAFLVNAAFALACRVPYFLPPIDLAVVAAVTSGGLINSSSDTLNVTLPTEPSERESLLSSPTRSAQLIAAFYVSYASVRVVVGFAQSVFAIALESAKDFPDAALEMSKGGILLLKLTPIVFVPALTLEMGLMFADTLCLPAPSPLLGPALCDASGLTYLTSAYPEIRRITFYAVVLMAVQLWQCLLHQFPNWTAAFRCLSASARLVAQVRPYQAPI